ncbi:MAG: (2Fe-2S)-binding protein [Rhodospirillales bacterium]|jgi:carbon-monoxide dehydrogenase small subunit|nr:(2Fe-2S)-binding protein [Rhodospirillales bacterium]
MSERKLINLKINGDTHELVVDPTETLLHVLREKLLLRGTKRGCNQGVCGACTVLIDDQPQRGCLSLAVNCTDREITTVEGMMPTGSPGSKLSPVQEAYMETGAVQCGFCTPGMVLTATALLKRNAKPDKEDIREAISGNLCRCSGYVKIVEAIQLAADGQAGGGEENG